MVHLRKSRRSGQKRLNDVLIEAKDRFYLHSGVTGALLEDDLQTTMRVAGTLFTALQHVGEWRRTMNWKPELMGRQQLADAKCMSTPTSFLVPPTPLNSSADQESLSSFTATSSADPTTTVGKQ